MALARRLWEHTGADRGASGLASVGDRPSRDRVASIQGSRARCFVVRPPQPGSAVTCCAGARRPCRQGRVRPDASRTGLGRCARGRRRPGAPGGLRRTSAILGLLEGPGVRRSMVGEGPRSREAHGSEAVPIRRIRAVSDDAAGRSDSRDRTPVNGPPLVTVRAAARSPFGARWGRAKRLSPRSLHAPGPAVRSFVHAPGRGFRSEGVDRDTGRVGALVPVGAAPVKGPAELTTSPRPGRAGEEVRSDRARRALFTGISDGPRPPSESTRPISLSNARIGSDAAWIRWAHRPRRGAHLRRWIGAPSCPPDGADERGAGRNRGRVMTRRWNCPDGTRGSIARPPGGG